MSHEKLLKEADRVIQPTIGNGSPFAILRDLAAALRAEMAANEQTKERLASAEAALRQEAGMENYQPDSDAAAHFVRYPEKP